MEGAAAPHSQPRRRQQEPIWKLCVRVPMGIYDLAAMAYLIYYATRWTGVEDPWKPGETKNALGQVGLALGAATLSFTVALSLVVCTMYNRLATTRKIGLEEISLGDVAFLTDIPAIIAALIAWVCNFSNAIWHSSYEGYPVPPDRPWVADQSIASGLIIGFCLVHLLPLCAACCVCCALGCSGASGSRPVGVNMRDRQRNPTPSTVGDSRRGTGVPDQPYAQHGLEGAGADPKG